jgi:phage-related tail fiber protein
MQLWSLPMPRDANGVYSQPPAYLAVTGETITALQHNTPLEDIASALTGSIARDGRTVIIADIPWAGKRITNLGAAVDGGDAVNKDYLRSHVPVGTVMQFIATAAPAGFLKLNGAYLSRTVYADLWAIAQASGALRTEAEWGAGYWGGFSVGDGSTTFRLPDFRGIFLRGWDDGRGTDSGRAVGAYQTSQNLSHNHGVSDPTHAHGVYDPGHAHSVADGGHSHGVNDPGHSHGYDRGSQEQNLMGGGFAVNHLGVNQGANTGGAGTGIYLSASGTGIGIYPAGTGIGIYGAATGISIQANGGAEARPQNQSLLYCIKY